MNNKIIDELLSVLRELALDVKDEKIKGEDIVDSLVRIVLFLEKRQKKDEIDISEKLDFLIFMQGRIKELEDGDKLIVWGDELFREWRQSKNDNDKKAKLLENMRPLPFED